MTLFLLRQHLLGNCVFFRNTDDVDDVSRPVLPGVTASARDIRIALAMRAYLAGSVRLVDHDLSGCSHLVATRHGLFAVDRQTPRLIAHGLFYGLTLREGAGAGDGSVYAFEAGDRPRSSSACGRIVRFHREGDRFAAAEVIATGLDNGCHQIDFVGDRLCVVDTYRQRILCLDPAGDAATVLRPIPGAPAGDWENGYAHVNSIVAHRDDILLMLHNGADRTGRPSEIARLDRDWRLVERIPIDGLGCHNVAVLEDGTLLACGSIEGGLVGPNGSRVPVGGLMTRGLSVGATEVAVGGSAFASREARDKLGEEGEGAVFFLDRDYRPLGRIDMPAPVMEVRRLDGLDRGLSAHLARHPGGG
jgi:hypothetical protein